MINRRRFLRAAGVSLLAAPRPVNAQQAKAVPRVAFLGNASAALSTPLLEAFRGGLRDLGYVHGQSIVIQSRFADGKQERVRGLVDELLALAPDVVLAAGPSVPSSWRSCPTPWRRGSSGASPVRGEISPGWPSRIRS